MISSAVDFEKTPSQHKNPKPFINRTGFASDCITITLLVGFNVVLLFLC